MEIMHPTTDSEIKGRNRLLAKSLRWEKIPFDIAEEYPIVLDPCHSEFSYILTHNNSIIAHANLWPRQLISMTTNQKVKVGLIGNVATDPTMRGKGLMSMLLRNIESTARRKEISYLILWSDLFSYYHRLGYEYLGKEYRFYFDQSTPIRNRYQFFNIDPMTLSAVDFDQILALRPTTSWTIQRTFSEFRKLLSIPATNLFLAFNSQDIAAYLICGKGADMVGVIHEWGGLPDLVVTGLDHVRRVLNLNEIILMTPKITTSDLSLFHKFCVRKEIHPMALAKAVEKSQIVNPEDVFIWGLDSI